MIGKHLKQIWSDRWLEMTKSGWDTEFQSGQPAAAPVQSVSWSSHVVCELYLLTQRTGVRNSNETRC